MQCLRDLRPRVDLRVLWASVGLKVSGFVREMRTLSNSGICVRRSLIIPCSLVFTSAVSSALSTNGEPGFSTIVRGRIMKRCGRRESVKKLTHIYPVSRAQELGLLMRQSMHISNLKSFVLVKCD